MAPMWRLQCLMYMVSSAAQCQMGSRSGGRKACSCKLHWPLYVIPSHVFLRLFIKVTSVPMVTESTNVPVAPVSGQATYRPLDQVTCYKVCQDH